MNDIGGEYDDFPNQKLKLTELLIKNMKEKELQNYFETFDGSIRNLFNTNDTKHILFILKYYYKYSTQKFQIVPYLFLPSKYVHNIEIVDLILKNEIEQNLNKKQNFLSNYISNFFENTISDFKIFLLFIENGFQLDNKNLKNLESKISKEQLKEVYFLYCKSNSNLNDFSILLKYFNKNNFFNELKEILNQNNKIELKKIEFLKEEENLLFYCKSLECFKFLIKNKI